MSRQRAKGTRFEGLVCDYLEQALGQPVERRPPSGAHDRGDVSGVRLADGSRVVIECKNCQRMELAEWVDEAVAEAANDGAAVGVVVHHRKGKGEASAGEQYATMRLADLARLIGGAR